MLQKHVPGAKVPADMVSITIFAWSAMARGVCWWRNHLINARTAMALAYKWQGSFKIVVKFAEVQAGRTYLRTHLLSVN
jgi:hypothetical protein